MFEQVISYLLNPVTSFLYLLVIFTPIEMLFPAKQKQRFFRAEWRTDICFFLGQYLLWIGFVFMTLAHFEQWVGTIFPSSFREHVAQLPFVYQFIGFVLLSDFLIYWGHRLQHKSDFLWKFHSIHHTAKELDWLAAHREHPLDALYTIGLINLPAIILGFPLQAIAAFTLFRGIWAIYIHSNIKLPMGPLGIIFGSPQIHHWHHVKDRDVGNYANLCPLMDVLFGTHYCPKHVPEELGVKEEHSNNYIGHLLYPFYFKNNSKKYHNKDLINKKSS